jgi:hypothetical protein
MSFHVVAYRRYRTPQGDPRERRVFCSAAGHYHWAVYVTGDDADERPLTRLVPISARDVQQLLPLMEPMPRDDRQPRNRLGALSYAIGRRIFRTRSGASREMRMFEEAPQHFFWALYNSPDAPDYLHQGERMAIPKEDLAFMWRLVHQDADDRMGTALSTG